MKVYEEVVQIGELRQKSILMLNEVKSILDHWGVNYWLDFGTLLGFVRDGKSMPWDGDYDLSTLDVDLEKKKGLWNELISRGYNVEIKYANIKITKKDWKIGHYRIDLHRLRINLKNDVEYAYGGIYKNKINQYFDSISKRLKKSSKKNIYLICVNPSTISSETEDPNDERNFRELKIDLLVI